MPLDDSSVDAKGVEGSTQSDINRRTFVKGALVVGASALAASTLSACANGSTAVSGAALQGLQALSPGGVSAICTNLAKACEKQRLLDEKTAFETIAEFYDTKMVSGANKSLDNMRSMLNEDLSAWLPEAQAAAELYADRGAKRSLVWNEKASNEMRTLLNHYASVGDSMLEDKNIYVCGVCGYIHIDQDAPDVCPICKVPKFKISFVGRG
ncbi:MAG: twin-arginine translocation signal domain-containing protein [Coriobacteriia bacterium]|nr:twin-arginine translocation signal domain-containing protein [Coriobacteriia bacterium]